MNELLDAGDYFTLETVLKDSGSRLPEAKRLYFKAHLENAFNQTEQSLQTIDLLFSKYKKSLNVVRRFSLLRIKCDNHRKQFEYRQSVEALDAMFPLAKSSFVLEELKRIYQEHDSLKNVPPQKFFHTTDAVIPVKKTKDGLLTMQVVCNGVTEEFLFDTGATNSAIAESVAERMGIKPLDGVSRVTAGTGIRVETKLGVADSLRINSLLFENVVFNILPDRQLIFPGDSTRGIIGFNLMNQMKEIRIDHKAGNIIVPQTPVKRDLHNLFLNGGDLVVQLESGQDTLLFSLDTGADLSSFSKKYFDAHHEKIIEKGQRMIVPRYGVGGGHMTELYRLTGVLFKIDGFEMTLPKIDIATQDIPHAKNRDGLLGRDVLMHSDEMILNFESMYLILRNKKE
ncbi:MAG: retropepsin-like domain-containing protein [Acidobacteriota bacterium]|jgi:predicted aspartyl protease|nr:retropepsin-like domain-containing protein [Acidobacteriota bacterium]